MGFPAHNRGRDVRVQAACTRTATAYRSRAPRPAAPPDLPALKGDAAARADMLEPSHAEWRRRAPSYRRTGTVMTTLGRPSAEESPDTGVDAEPGAFLEGRPVLM